MTRPTGEDEMSNETKAPQPPSEAQAVYEGTDLEGGWVRRTTPPSAPVGVVLTAKEREWLEYAVDHMADDSEPEDATCYEVLHGLMTRVDALAQQPASDGGFTAADMMDARQEGRKEAQQPAGFSAGDMADAAAQGFRDGVASVEAAAVDEAMVERAMDAAMEIKHNKETWFPITRRRMKRALTAALAAKQGGEL